MDDGAVLLVVSALLGQGRRVHELSLVMTLAGLVAAIVAGPTVPVIGLSVAVLVMAGVETTLAVRVGLDAALFRQLAAGRFSVNGLDEGLYRAGLTTSPMQRRNVDSRIAGARRLLMRQAAVAAAQLALVIALIVTAWGMR